MSSARDFGAVRRGRAVRDAALGRLAPSKRATLTTILVAILVAALLSIPGPGGTNLANAAVQRAKSLIELLHQRSPGKRTTAHLAMTKHKKVALHERALPKVRRRAPAPAMAALPAFPAELPPAFVDLVAPPIPMQLASLEALPVGPFAEQPLFPFVPSAQPGGFIFPPGETTTPPVVTPPVGPPQTAVPEPGSWAMMLLGFGAIGWSLRRKGRREQTAA